MTELSPCPFCKDEPAVQGTKRPSAKLKWFAVKCISRACADRIVETHRFATEEEAARAWNERVA